jgi:hypothetical protein
MSDKIKTFAELLADKQITGRDALLEAIRRNGKYTIKETVDGKVVERESKLTISEAFSTPDASILFPKVIQNVLEEAAEPRQILTPLLSVIRTEGRAVEFPAVGALRAAEVPEGQEYPDQSLVFTKRLEGKVSKKGLKVPITDETIADSQWDIVGLHLRAAGRAMQRLKEAIAQERFTDEAIVELDNSGGAGTYETTGVDNATPQVANGSMSLMDIITLAGSLIAEERNFTHLIMHPLTWVILAKDPVVRQFQIYGDRSVYTTQVPSGRNLFDDKSFVNMFPWVPQIILSPYVRWDDSGSAPITDVYAIDAEDIGSMLVREEIVTEKFDNPTRDIQTLKLKERYDIVVYGEKQIRMAQGIVVTRNYEVFA